MKSSFITKIGVFLLCLFLANGAKATEYYVDANSTSSTQNGTQASPWKTIAQVNSSMNKFVAGDIIYLKRGSIFTGPLTITRSGTASAPITFTNYGTGNLPIITGSSKAVTMYGNRSYVVINGLAVTDVNMDPDDHYAQAAVSTAFEVEGSYLTVKNCEISMVGCGINLGGDFNTIDNNKIFNLRMIKNTPTSQNSDDDYGASPIVVSGANNMISSNWFKDCWAYSYDYGYDGGGVEFYGDGSGDNKIMYNTAINCNGFMEYGSSSGGESNNNMVAYNLLINCGDLVYTNTSGQYAINVKNLQVYNNIFVETKMQFTGVGQMIIIGSNCTISMKNNIFWLTDGVDVARSGIFSLAQNTHENNIYHLGSGSVLGFTANSSETSTMVPLFTSVTAADPAAWNYNPLSTSPAIDFGKSVGLTRDFAGTSVAGNSTPNAGMLEGGAAPPPTTPLAATSTAPAVDCNGGTSTVTVAATGGTAPYTGTGTFTKPAGTHTFTVKDATGASTTTSVVITQPLLPLTTVLSAGVILLNGGVTLITTVAAGGTIPYTYSLNSGAFQSSNIFNNIAAGAYRITVKDAKGCTVTESITVTQPGPAPAPLVAAATATGSIACNGGTASVTVSATGGTTPYTGTGTFTRAAGTHSFTVTDAAGVTSTTSVTISEPTALTSTATSGTIAVNGGTTSITAGAAGGTTPYTYKVNNGTYQSSNTFNNIAAGTYSVTAKDAKGCTSVKSITITEPAQIPTLVASANAGTIACNGGTTTVTVSATGGTAPYTGTGSFTRAAGTFSFTVTDAAGITANTSVTIAQPSAVNGTLTAGTIAVNGGTTTLTAAGSGGTAPYSYKLNNGNFVSSGAFTSVAAGTHTVTIRDNNQCTVTKTITITELAPVPALVASGSVTGTIACNGGTTTVNIAATGGTAPYTGTGNFTRAAGSYTFIVTDAAGVTDDVAITVSEPTVLNATVTAGTITVNGGSTTMTITATGGTAPYTYKSNNGAYQSSNTFNNVTAGSYTLTVKDANGCTVSKTRTISQPGAPPVLVAAASAGTISCNGGTTSVVITATGGTGSYTGTGTFTKAAGTYTFVVTDAAGVTDDVTITVAQPTLINATVATGTIAVNGGSTTATVTATGGTAGYTYSYDNGTYQSSNTFTNVLAGTHTIVTKDSKGCTTSKSFTVNQPNAIPALVAAASAGTINCYGENTTVTVTATGGVSPYTGTGTYTKAAGTYTFTVTDASGKTDDVTITVAQPAAITVAVATGTIAVNGGSTTASVTATGGTGAYTYSYDNGTYQTSGSFSNVIAGTHNIKVKDAKGCIGVKSFTVSQPGAIPPVVAAATASAISCNGGSSTVTVTATGGTAPYTGVGSFAKAAGTYTFTVKDANGLTDDVTITIAQPAAINITVAAGTIAENGGSTTATISVTGGTSGYTYKLNEGNFQSLATFSALTAGAYTVTVKDAKGCTATKAFSLTEPAVVVPDELGLILSTGGYGCRGSNSGYIRAEVRGGSGPYTYRLNNGAYGTSNTFTKLGAGTYSVTVKDASQRTVSSRVVITESRKRCNAIFLTAMGNPSITTFRVKIETESSEKIMMTVMNMSGQKVYEGIGKPNDINTFGKDFTQGTYILRVQQGTEVETLRLIKAR